MQRGCPREPRMPLALDATGGGCFAAPLNFPRGSDIAPYRHAVLRSLAHCVGCACLYRKKKKTRCSSLEANAPLDLHNQLVGYLDFPRA